MTASAFTSSHCSSSSASSSSSLASPTCQTTSTMHDAGTTIPTSIPYSLYHGLVDVLSWSEHLGLFSNTAAKCSNMVKGMGFKFDLHVPRDSPDMTPYKISKKGAWPESRDPLNFTWQIYACTHRVPSSYYNVTVLLANMSTKNMRNHKMISYNNIKSVPRQHSSTFIHRYQQCF